MSVTPLNQAHVADTCQFTRFLYGINITEIYRILHDDIWRISPHRISAVLVQLLSRPVFQYQARYPLKLPHIIRHQNGAGSDGVSGYRRVVRTDRRPGEAQRHLNLRGRIHRGVVPGQDGIEAGAERVNQLHVARRGLRAGGTEARLVVGVSLDIENYCTLRLFFVLPGCGKGD